MERGAADISARATVQTRFAHGVVIHYHEIGLKGRNRGYFERWLQRNLRSTLDGCEQDGIDILSGRFLVRTRAVPSSAILDRVARTFGVAAFAPCVVVDATIDDLTVAALDLLAQRPFATFAIAARRATKDLPLTSRQINVGLGAAVQAATGAGVNLGSPDVTVYVEVLGRRAFVYTDRAAGPGGLPVGSSGKIVSLLSGGIDSPVATLRVLKRGAKAILCHFHSAPFTDRSSARKAVDLARLIADWQGDTMLYVVPIGAAQQQIVVAAPPSLRVVLYRRLMVRLGAEVARREGAKALVLGDSLGQVASQTLDNIACVDHAATMPLLRPLIGDDKQDIVTEARRIGTYETSILPYEDCCSLFVPRSPATHASIEACVAAEAELEVDALLTMCMAEVEVERLTRVACGAAA